MRSTGFIRTLAVMTSVVALAACSKSSALTKAEMITQGDKICTTARTAIDALSLNDLGGPSADNMAQYAEGLDTVIPLFEKMITDLGVLEPPEADAAKITEMLGHLQDEVDVIKEAQQAAAAGDLDGFNAAAQKSGDADATATQIATDYGFKVCGT